MPVAGLVFPAPAPCGVLAHSPLPARPPPPLLRLCRHAPCVPCGSAVIRGSTRPSAYSRDSTAHSSPNPGSPSLRRKPSGASRAPAGGRGPDRRPRRAASPAPSTGPNPPHRRPGRREYGTPPGLVYPADFTDEGGRAAADALQELDDPPTAVSCANDPIVIGLLTGAQESRWRVSGDLPVAGCDGIRFGTMRGLCRLRCTPRRACRARRPPGCCWTSSMATWRSMRPFWPPRS